VVSSLAGSCTSSAALQRLLLHEFGVCLDFLAAAATKDHNVRHASYAADLASVAAMYFLTILLCWAV